MKRIHVLLIIAVTVLVVSFMALESVNAKRSGSGTSKVTINGRSFVVGKHSPDSKTALRREFAKLGVNVPEDSETLELSKHLKTAIAEKPVTYGKASPEKIPQLPEGFRVEKTLKMSGEDGTTLMVMGTTTRKGGSAAARLEADQWIKSKMIDGPDLPKTFSKTRGKETDIVCLDEKNGSFLMLRRQER